MPQEPSHAVLQLLSRSGLLPTPNWYKNFVLEEGFPTKVPSLKCNRPISGNRKTMVSAQAHKPAQGVRCSQPAQRSANQIRYFKIHTSSLDHAHNPVRSTVLISAQTSPLFQLRRLDPTSFTRKPALQTVGGGRSSIRSTTGFKTPSSACTRRSDEFSTDGNTSARWPEQVRRRRLAAAGGGVRLGEEGAAEILELEFPCGNHESSTCVTLNGSGIQLAVGPQPLRLRNHNFGLAHRIMLKRLATLPHDPIGITDSACKNQLVVVSVQYGPFNTYIPIRSTTIGKSRVARDPIAMHTSWRSNIDIASVTR
ncbi:hypothetical protein F511_15248 [Dorcoceras hygrometricum]|uniref:Cleavage stimulation factor subunit 2-like n=1 Tax=Dorcoceras hygrometricum TaxID=472368 RepID=A0A2Z7AL63_9LAMI|nr:hypothetical protein F511_15248 [Dorcoceras hygrometricum]